MKHIQSFKSQTLPIFSLMFVLTILLSSPFQVKANWQFAAGGGAATGFGPGFYNAPPMGAGMPGVNPLWGGGYNLNSLSGGGWGGFPAGYGFGPSYPYAAGGAMPGGGFNGGALTAGFGGYYSPFIGGF